MIRGFSCQCGDENDGLNIREYTRVMLMESVIPAKTGMTGNGATLNWSYAVGEFTPTLTIPLRGRGFYSQLRKSYWSYAVGEFTSTLTLALRVRGRMGHNAIGLNAAVDRRRLVGHYRRSQACSLYNLISRRWECPSRGLNEEAGLSPALSRNGRFRLATPAGASPVYGSRRCNGLRGKAPAWLGLL